MQWRDWNGDIRMEGMVPGRSLVSCKAGCMYDVDLVSVIVGCQQTDIKPLCNSLPTLDNKGKEDNEGIKL